MSKNIKTNSTPKIRELTLTEIKNVSGGAGNYYYSQRVSSKFVGKSPVPARRAY